MNRIFDYFQIAGLAFFLIVFLGRTLYLRFSKNINPITLGVGKKGFQRIVELSFFVGLIVWIIEVLLYALHTEFRLFPAPLDMQLIDTMPAKLIGVAGELVTTGIFAVSRNPIFIFIDIYFIGTFLINGTLIFLVFVALVVIGVHYQIIQEEKFLAKTYWQAYQDYCARTGRYFGWQRTLHSSR